MKKKLYFLLSLLAFVFVGAAQAQTTQVTTTDGLSDGDYILISSTSGTYFTGTGTDDYSYFFNGTGTTKVTYGSTIPASCMFIVEVTSNEEGSFYLKQVSSKKYVATATAVQSATIPALASSTDGAAIFTLNNTDESTPETLGYSSALRIKTYKNNDGTNHCYLRPKNDGTADYHNGNAPGTLSYIYKYDTTPELVTVTYTATYNSTVKETQNVTYSVGDEFRKDIFTSLPDFYTATGFKEGTVTSNDDEATCDVTITYSDYPVPFSSSLDEATWVFLSIGGDKYKVHDNGTESYIDVSTRTDISMADKGDLWCFVGNPFDGFTIYNGNNNYPLVMSRSYYDGKAGTSTYALLGTETSSQLWDISDVPAGNANTIDVDGAFYICDHGTFTDGRHCLGINSGKVTFNNFYYKKKIISTSNAFTASTDIAWTLNDGGDNNYYSTLYLPYEAAVPEGVTAYTGALDTENAKVTMEEISNGIIPANEGVLLVGNGASATLSLSSTSAANFKNNCLKGTCSNMADVTTSSYYVFGKGSAGVGFYHPSSTTLLANRAYIECSDTSVKGLSLSFGDGTTGIAATLTETPAATNAPLYDLSGRRVVKPTRGIYIQGGKKVLVK